MTPEQFLLTILPPPAEGEAYFSVGLAKGQRPDICKCTNAAELQERGDLNVRFGLNAYMALGSFGVEAGRTAANARRFRCFWADLDVGKERNAYATQQEAIASLLKFVQATGLKPSIVVSSGRGYHVYWALQDALPIAQWQPIAGWFKALCQQEGLIIDPVCTADAARILRMPGTVHMATGSTVCVVQDIGIRWEIRAFLGCIQRHLKNISAPAAAPAAAPASAPVRQAPDERMEMFGMGAEPPKAHAERIARNCPQILCMGHAAEPVWYLSMNVLKRCKDGREWAHKLSAFDAKRYTFEGTEAKFDRAKPDSPTLCKTFEAQNPEYCKQCKFYGRLRSPIELDRYAPERQEATPAPAAPAAQANRLHIPDGFDTPRVGFRRMPNANYYVDQHGIHHVASVKDGDDYVDKDTVICRTQLYFKRTDVSYEDREWHTDYVFDAVYPEQGGEKEVHLVVDAFHAAPNKWFSDHLIHPTTVKNQSLLMGFVNAYLEQVVHRSPVRHKYSTYGWTEVQQNNGDKLMGFVTEGCVITENGVEAASFTRPSTDPTRQVFTRSGTLEAWKLAPKIYRILNQPLGQLAMCFSFAAPLMRYGSGEAKNCLLNIYSRDGGRGKSHVLRFAASVWGNPAKAFFQKDSSVVARQKRLALWHNMPAMMDEISHLSDEDMTNLVFSIITGEEKQKLTINSDFRNTGNWSTCTLATSNKPVKEFVARMYADSDAGQLRVMDYECDFQILDQGGMEMQCLNKCVQLSEHNYGHAGPEFIYQLLQRKERLSTLEAKVASWVASKEFTPRERFYSYPLGLALQAGRWAVEFGLLDYDMDALEKWVFTTFLASIRIADDDLKHTPHAVLADYINDRILQNGLIVKREERLPEEPPQEDSTVPDSYIARRPVRSLTIRYELENQKLYFSKQDFNMWCAKQGWSPRTALKELKALGHVTETNMRVVLGRNIAWLPHDRTYCVMMDAKALKRSGVLTEVQ